MDASQRRFLSVVARALGVQASDVTMEGRRGTVRGWDSLGQLKIFMALEREYGIRFPSRTIASAETVSDIYRIVKESS